MRTFLFVILALAMLNPAVPSGAALVAGIAVALTLGNPRPGETKRLTPWLLQASVVGLGAAMDLAAVARAGAQGFFFTLAGIAIALALGSFLGRLLGCERDSTLLITVGTAICGGSAIAAVAPVIRAKPQDVSVALGTVFVLNAVGLVLFPVLGRELGLSQQQFGLWSALAIHDTSSVVGAALQFGEEALEVATSVKLARALWIVPLTFGIAWWSGHGAGKAKRPWFILGFVLTAALVTWVPGLRGPGEWIAWAARRTLVLTLFLIGTGLTRATLGQVGPRPLLLGVALWILLGTGSLGAVLWGIAG